uniref:28 kDa Metastriate family member n=1 Tax=Rhipicephalus zambeziensis TaxID=60191 RepID=A0A224YB43_9ACAR
MLSLYYLSLAAFGILAISICTNAEQGNVDEIGDNITIDAHIFYTYDTHANMAEVQGEHASPESKNDNITKYFMNLFETVQLYLRFNNISINLNVTNVTEKGDLIEMYVNECENVDGPITLAKVEKYGRYLSGNVTRNTIFYLFTWENITDYYTQGSQVVNFSASAVATYNTFCSENTSAALVQLGSLEVYSTSKATAHTFGSTLPPKHLLRLNETFKRCIDLRSEKGNTDAPPTDVC